VSITPQVPRASRKKKKLSKARSKRNRSVRTEYKKTVLKYYLKSSDENEKKAVRILDRLMEEIEVGSSFVGRQA